MTVSADSEPQAVAVPAATSEEPGVATDGGPTTAEPNPGTVFEPSDALLDRVDGWTAVDTWFREPVGVPSTPGCEPMDRVLDLERWGITTSLWLRDGDELWQHVADLNTEDNAADYVDAFGSLAAACSSQTTGNGAFAIEPLRESTWPGFALIASDNTQATWLFEPGSRTQYVVLSRGNVVSIVSVTTNDPVDSADLRDAVALAQHRLDAMLPQTSGQRDREQR